MWGVQFPEEGWLVAQVAKAIDAHYADTLRTYISSLAIDILDAEPEEGNA